MLQNQSIRASVLSVNDFVAISKVIAWAIDL
jgi:hypothetical protein